MAITRWDPWSEIASLQRDVQELFGRGAAPVRRPAGAMVPLMDAVQRGDGLVLRFELPGMDADDVTIDVSRGVLTVSGERRGEEEVAEEQWLRRERTFGSFSRSLTLPEDVNPQEITASFDRGVLEVRVPQAAERRPHRVQIETGDQQQRPIDVSESQSSAV